MTEALASAMEPVMTQPTEGESLWMYETDEGSMSLSGTFFCEMTTAQSLPRTPTEVMFAAVMALNAYSVECESGVALTVGYRITHRLGRDDPDPRRW